MNKIIEEARELGISLVGWVETAEKIGDHQYAHVTRVTAHGDCVTVWDDLSWTIVSNTGQLAGDEFTIKSPVDLNNYVAEHYGGWAPAPIGYGLDQWQPIETAPKDGSFVLVCVWDGEPWVKEYQQWQAPLTASYRGFHPNAPGKKLWRDKEGRLVTPTHWMPLPAPPEVEG